MADDNDQWSCTSCTLMNTLTAEVCEACGVTSPLVLESYEAEERVAAMSASGNSSPTGHGKKTRGTRGRGSSQESMASDALSEDIASEMDPWTQAELEWAHVEAHQESTTPKKRK